MRVVRLVCAVSAHFYICIMRIRRSWAKGAAVLTIPEGKACGNTKKKRSRLSFVLCRDWSCVLLFKGGRGLKSAVVQTAEEGPAAV